MQGVYGFLGLRLVESCVPFFHSKGRERIINHFVISKVELLNEIGILEYEEIFFFFLNS